MTASKWLGKWKIAGICFMAITVVVVAGIAIGCWNRNSSERATGSMAGQLSSLNRNEMTAIESSFRLIVPGDAKKLCMLFLHDHAGAGAYMRIDVPLEKKQNILESGLFAGAIVEEAFPMPAFNPPDEYGIRWWEMPLRDGEQMTIYQLNTRGEGGRAMAVFQESEGGHLSVHIQRNSRLDVYTAEFMSFISSHPRQRQGIWLFPPREQAFAGCWTPPAGRDSGDAANSNRN